MDGFLIVWFCIGSWDIVYKIGMIFVNNNVNIIDISIMIMIIFKILFCILCVFKWIIFVLIIMI